MDHFGTLPLLRQCRDTCLLTYTPCKLLHEYSSLKLWPIAVCLAAQRVPLRAVHSMHYVINSRRDWLTDLSRPHTTSIKGAVESRQRLWSDWNCWEQIYVANCESRSTYSIYWYLQGSLPPSSTIVLSFDPSIHHIYSSFHPSIASFHSFIHPLIHSSSIHRSFIHHPSPIIYHPSSIIYSSVLSDVPSSVVSIIIPSSSIIHRPFIVHSFTDPFTDPSILPSIIHSSFVHPCISPSRCPILSAMSDLSAMSILSSITSILPSIYWSFHRSSIHQSFWTSILSAVSIVPFIHPSHGSFLPSIVSDLSDVP